MFRGGVGVREFSLSNRTGHFRLVERRPEVDQHRQPPFVKEDVAGLDVAVVDPLAMQIVQTTQQEQKPLGGLLQGYSALPGSGFVHTFPQRTAFQPRHHIEDAAMGLEDVVDPDDAFMVQGSQRLRFLAE